MVITTHGQQRGPCSNGTFLYLDCGGSKIVQTHTHRGMNESIGKTREI